MNRSEFFQRLDRAVRSFHGKIMDPNITCAEARLLQSVVDCAVEAGLLPRGSQATEENPIIKLIRYLEEPTRDRRWDNMSIAQYRLNEAAWDYLTEQSRIVVRVRRLFAHAIMLLTVRWQSWRVVLNSMGW